MENSIHSKLYLTFKLLTAIPVSFPFRLFRILRHFPALLRYISTPCLYGIHFKGINRLLLWLGEIPFLLLDLLGFPEWYELGSLWVKPRSRTLTDEELTWVKSMFGETLPYTRIRIDEGAHLGPRQYRFCYVSFCVINSWQAMSPAVLMHELVHVWQFKQYGSPYIVRALLAQSTQMGYDYGGIVTLQRARKQGRSLSAFNYEQQAAIIEDYFRLLAKGPLRWGRSTDPKDLDTYRYFARPLTEIHF